VPNMAKGKELQAQQKSSSRPPPESPFHRAAATRRHAFECTAPGHIL
jgi:hypothetical protein